MSQPSRQMSRDQGVICTGSPLWTRAASLSMFSLERAIQPAVQSPGLCSGCSPWIMTKPPSGVFHGGRRPSRAAARIRRRASGETAISRRARRTSAGRTGALRGTLSVIFLIGIKILHENLHYSAINTTCRSAPDCAAGCPGCGLCSYLGAKSPPEKARPGPGETHTLLQLVLL